MNEMVTSDSKNKIQVRFCIEDVCMVEMKMDFSKSFGDGMQSICFVFNLVFLQKVMN